jgi:hypothetical protein
MRKLLQEQAMVMDEIFVRDNLIKPVGLKELSAKSNRAGFVQGGGRVAEVVATGFALSISSEVGGLSHAFYGAIQLCLVDGLF